jgi:hypothetical protein
VLVWPVKLCIEFDTTEPNNYNNNSNNKLQQQTFTGSTQETIPRHRFVVWDVIQTMNWCL